MPFTSFGTHSGRLAVAAALALGSVLPVWATPTATSTVTVNGPVTLDHNRFSPRQGQTLSVLGIKPEHGEVTVSVLSLNGQQIRRLRRAAGDPEPLVWDGRNEQGAWAASGVYVLVAQGVKLIKRLRVAVLN